MLSKAQIKHIQSLAKKKDRIEHQQFVIEGTKTVEEAVQSDWKIVALYHSVSYAHKNEAPPISVIIEDYVMEKISQQKTPSGLLAIAQIKPTITLNTTHQKIIALDHIQDPGNFGSIIRTADWFGIDAVYCSQDTVDLYNPKVLQASMGSFLRIPVIYGSLNALIDHCPIYATAMHGKDYRGYKKEDKMALLIGNEANGIEEKWLSAAKKTVSIPRKGKAESLNAALACGILSAHFFS